MSECCKVLRSIWLTPQHSKVRVGLYSTLQLGMDEGQTRHELLCESKPGATHGAHNRKHRWETTCTAGKKMVEQFREDPVCSMRKYSFPDSRHSRRDGQSVIPERAVPSDAVAHQRPPCFLKMALLALGGASSQLGLLTRRPVMRAMMLRSFFVGARSKADRQTW